MGQLFLWNNWWGCKTLWGPRSLLGEEPAATIWAGRVGNRGLMFADVRWATGLGGLFWTSCLICFISFGGFGRYCGDVVNSHDLNQNPSELNKASIEWPHCPYPRSSSRGHHRPHPHPSQIMEPGKRSVSPSVDKITQLTGNIIDAGLHKYLKYELPPFIKHFQ